MFFGYNGFPHAQQFLPLIMLLLEWSPAGAGGSAARSDLTRDLGFRKADALETDAMENASVTLLSPVFGSKPLKEFVWDRLHRTIGSLFRIY